ncbi:hypothetical protein [Campylobacter sp. RM12651]|uniref:hypothetical protein n=1 Tax=Campylobacter sp. RM12651 TaxID=1660079 RepID=UPI001EFC2838|nr:hypothetical protein [Campylobacter sp. RM12651]ULO03770.1 putative membrane protein [Campylobacter sp. RM12651]
MSVSINLLPLVEILLHILISFALLFNYLIIFIILFDMKTSKYFYFFKKSCLMCVGIVVYTILELYISNNPTFLVIFLACFFISGDIFDGLFVFVLEKSKYPSRIFLLIYTIIPFCLFATLLILDPTLLEDKIVFSMCVILFIITIYQISHCEDIFEYICGTKETSNEEK